MLSQPTILVCTDLSENSDKTLKAAEQIRRRSYGKIHVLHVSEYPLQWDWVDSEVKDAYLSDAFRQQMNVGLEQRVQEQIRRCEAEASFEVMNGIIYSGITEVIQQQKATLLMMAHKGKGGTPFHLGGQTAKMVASSSIPLLIIKKEFEVNRVAALVDTKETMKSIITASEEISFVFSARLEVVSLWKETFTQFFNMTSLDKNNKLLKLTKEEQKEVLDKMQKEIRKQLDPHSKATVKVAITTERQVAYHLLEILKEDDTDLVVMERHQKGRVEKFLIGSETRRMLELFPGNLLILAPPPIVNLKA